jgi:Domain of unknown function (DUF5122) beta-propeller
LLALRVMPDGSPDPTFGTDGIASISIDGIAAKIAVDRVGRVVVAGTYSSDFVVARFMPAGSPDVQVGPEGWARPGLGGNPPQNQAYATAMKLQPNGSIVVAGFESIVVFGVISIVRFLGDVAAVPSLSVLGSVLFAAILGLTGILALRRL